MNVSFSKAAAAECRKRGWSIVHLFTIVYVGWESDNEAAIAQDQEGAMHTLTTDHGALCVDVLTAAELEETVSKTQRWADRQRQALMILLKRSW